MAETNQHQFSLAELVELILRSKNIHEGKWLVSMGIGVGVGNFGPTQDQTFPGATITVNQFGIQRAVPGTPIANPALVVDAAKVNPKKASAKKSGQKKAVAKKTKRKKVQRRS